MRKRNKEKQLTSWGKHRSKEEVPFKQKKKKKGSKEEKQQGGGSGGREERRKEEKEDAVECGTGE